MQLPALQHSTARHNTVFVNYLPHLEMLCCEHILHEHSSLMSTGTSLVQGLLQSGAAPEVAELLKLICKAFWSATYMGIPDTLLQQDQFVGWMTCIHALMEMPIPKVSSLRGFVLCTTQ